MSQQFPPNSNQPWNTSPPPYGQPGYPPPSSPLPAQEYGQTTPSRGPQFAKKPKRWPWIVAIFVALMIGYGAGSAGHSSTATTPSATTQAAPTQSVAVTKPTSVPAAAKPTAVPKWVTTHTFTGNGSQKTATFTAPGDWKLNWSCNLAASNMGGQYNVIIDVTSSDGTPLDPAAINTLCKTGNTSGSTEERQGGSVYLDVNSEDNWTITVQELK